jgi:hypothetical protein
MIELRPAGALELEHYLKILNQPTAGHFVVAIEMKVFIFVASAFLLAFLPSRLF